VQADDLVDALIGLGFSRKTIACYLPYIRRAEAWAARNGYTLDSITATAHSGLRRNEIGTLRWSQIGQDGWLTVVGKGDVTRSIPLHNAILDALGGIRPADRSAGSPQGSEWVFPGRYGGQPPMPEPAPLSFLLSILKGRGRRVAWVASLLLAPEPQVRHVASRDPSRRFNGSRRVATGRGLLNPTTLWGWIREVSRDAGLGDIKPHILRHTALSTALDRTRDLRAVQELAGHARPETTAGYTRVRRDRLVEVVTAIDYDLEEIA
jgi:integrase